MRLLSGVAPMQVWARKNEEKPERPAKPRTQVKLHAHVFSRELCPLGHRGLALHVHPLTTDTAASMSPPRLREVLAHKTLLSRLARIRPYMLSSLNCV